MDVQTRMRGSASLSRQLSRAGLGLLALFVFSVGTSFLPLRLMEPGWQLRVSSALTNNGSVALLGVLLVAVASWLAPEDDLLLRRNTLLRRLALAAVVGYLLLIPLQTLALWRGVDQGKQRISRERQAVEARLEAISKAVETAQTPAELQRQLQGLPGAPLLPEAQLAEPMPQLRQRMATALELARSRIRATSSEPDPARIQKLITESLRISLSALALAFAFAAGAQSGVKGQSLLDQLQQLQQARETARRKGIRR